MTELERAQRTEILELKTAYATAISQRDAAEARLQEVYESVRKYMAEQRNEEETK